jgi:hypothetical protein
MGRGCARLRKERAHECVVAEEVFQVVEHFLLREENAFEQVFGSEVAARGAPWAYWRRAATSLPPSARSFSSMARNA